MLYSLHRALMDLAIVFVVATAFFVPLAVTGVSEQMLAWTEAYPRLAMTELFVYAILVTTGFALAILRRWIQLTDALQRYHAAGEDLRAQKAELQRSNEELERFAYVASHDLREPLRTIHSHLSLLERDAGPKLSEKAMESLEFARDGAGRMDRMVKSLMTYAKLERDEARTRPIDPNPALEDALANLETIAERADVEIETSELPWVWADQSELVLLFQNLLQNAIKHSRRLGARVRVGGHLDGDRARLWVEDQGPGIPEGQRERVFELFRQGSYAEQKTGAGIGLTVCKRIVERHDGEIWIEDGETGGARVVIELRGFE